MLKLIDSRLSLLSLLLLSGCGVNTYNFSKLPLTLKPEATDVPPVATPSPRPTDHTSQALRHIQPAVAVRAASCLMCHANIQSNVVTDFGFGEDYFLGGPNNSSNGSFYFNHELNSWQSAKIQGSLIVPKAIIERSVLANVLNTIDPDKKLASISLADFLQAPVMTDASGNGIPARPSMTVGITPPAGSAAVDEHKTVYIGAPSEADIISIAPNLKSVQVGFAQTGRLASKPVLSGMEQTGTGTTAYVRNVSQSTLVCYGDVVVKGVLFLNNPSIETDSNGCRIYVTGSVFVQGKIQYLGGASQANLQISSARAIMMGFNPTSIGERLLISGDRTWALPFEFTRGPGSNGDKGRLILADANLISDLVDADQVDSTVAATYAFEHMLLNAPQVHSRYQRPFTGVLVGEIVLFRLGQFVFAFDPIFITTPALPALPNDVLTVKD